MCKSCTPGLPMVPLCIIGEARTHDNGKLLFKIATEDGEALLLIKIKGIKEEYYLPISELNAFIMANAV